MSLDGNTSLTVTATNTDVYQWKTFNGVSWLDVTYSGIHSGSGATTNTISINNPTNTINGNQYRILVSSTAFVCVEELSNTAVLTVNVGTVITKRRITYRLNRN